MADETYNFDINVNVRGEENVDRLDQKIERVQQKAQQGVNVLGGGTVPGTPTAIQPSGAAPARVQPTAPVGMSPAMAATAARVQAEVSAAIARGDPGAARALAAGAASIGINIPIPATPPGPSTGLEGWSQPLNWQQAWRSGTRPMFGMYAPGSMGPPLPPTTGDPYGSAGAQFFGRQVGPVPYPGYGTGMPYGSAGSQFAGQFVGPMPATMGTTPATGAMPGGFGPGGAMYNAPIGPPVAPGFTPAQSRWQRFRGVMNAPVPGVSRGLYMQAMFGLWDVSQTAQAQRLAGLQASVADTDIERMHALTEGLNTRAGIFGSIVQAGWNLLGDYTGIDSPSKVQETGLLETKRRATLDIMRDDRLRRRGERALYATVGMPEQEYRAGLAKAQSEFEQRTAKATLEQQNIRQQLNETERIWGFYQDQAGGLPAFGRQTQLRLRDPGARGALAQRDKDLQDELKAAAEQRAAAEKQLESQRRMDQLAANSADRATLLTAAGRSYQAEFEKIHGLEVSGKLSPHSAIVARNAAYLANQREVGISLRELAGETYASSLARTGNPLASALASIDARFGTAFANLDRSNPMYGKQVAGLRAAQAEENRVAQQEEFRRLIQIQAMHETAGLALSRSPLGADLRGIIGQRDAKLFGVTNQAEIARINQAAQDDARQALQQRADQIQNLNINQRGRGAQLDALLRRDPFSAEVAGTVAQARAEEARLRQAGFTSQADTARDLGIKQLQLLRQNYLEGFTPVQTSQQFPWSLLFNKKDAEDPLTVMKNIESGIKDLSQPGTVADASKVLGDILSWLQNLPNVMQGLIAN